MPKIKTAQHLFEIYPSMPRYANDPEQSDIIKTYDFLLRRFQGFYGNQPTYFVKSGTCPLLFGDQHQYYGYDHISLSSTQDIIVAVGRSSNNKIRINNYQSALYGQRVIGSNRSDWKFQQKSQSQKFYHVFIKICGIVSDELNLNDLGGIDIMIYSGLVQDEFVGWKESLYAAFYCAIIAVITNNKPIEDKTIRSLMKAIGTIDQEIVHRPQLTNYQIGCITQHGLEKVRNIALNNQLNLVIAHSLTPLPKKLIQGKRFNLRRCEILIAIEYLKNFAGTTKQLQSLRQVQQFIGCTIEQLIKQIEENIPQGKISSEQIQQATDKSLIDIMKEVPYANNVIDQNSEYYPRERALFFLKQQLIVSALTSQNLIDSLKQSYRNQVDLLGIGSQQIQQLIEAASPWSLAHKIIGNGWGGNVLFICDKANTSKLIDEAINKFYLSEQNRILLSDDLEQYIHVVDKPATGLALLDPQSEIWY